MQCSIPVMVMSLLLPPGHHGGVLRLPGRHLVHGDHRHRAVSRTTPLCVEPPPHAGYFSHPEGTRLNTDVVDTDCPLTCLSQNPPPTLEGDFPPVLKNFVSSCLQKDPSNRATAASLLRHPFITEASPDPPPSLMKRIETRLRIVRDGSAIDRILDQESRSNSRRSMINRTTDSGGCAVCWWDAPCRRCCHSFPD